MADDLAQADCVKLVRLQTLPDARGGLAVGQLDRLVPFETKRIFIVHDVPANTVRGEHAHKECHQLLIATRGSVTVEVDDGRSRGAVVLDDPATALYLPPMTWGVQRDYSADCSLLVLTSHAYDAADYIHDHDEFLALVEARA